MNRQKSIVKISLLGIAVNTILVVFKMIVGLLANSIAIILDAVNNLSDALSSLITIIGAFLSGKKPDKKHPYGYGRIEYFSSIIIAIIILLAGVTSLRESFFKIIDPVQADYSIFSLIIIVVAIFVKFFFGGYVKKQGKQLNSGSLVASGTDAISDSILSLSTLIAAIISLLFSVSLEGYLGFIISIFILKSAFEILRDTVNDMIGVRADDELVKKIKKEVLSYKLVQGVYDLTLHNYGPNKLIGTLHIQVDDDMNASSIHRLTRKITISVFEKFGIILTVGIYASNDKGKYKDIQKYVRKICDDYKSIIQVHGFYVDDDSNDISFDLIFDFSEGENDRIVNEIRDRLKEKYPMYNFSIIVDIDFSD